MLGVRLFETVRTLGIDTLADMTGQLIVSVSGLSDQTLGDVDGFCSALDARGVPVSLLVAPRLKGGYRLEADIPTVEWLKQRRAGGAAVVMHGYDAAVTKKRRGEFAALPAHEANLRLMGADRVLEHVGLRTRLFAAPGWTASEGTILALPRNGFRMVAGLHGMTDLVTGASTRARLLGVGAGFLSEPWWCRTLVLATERTARRGGIARLAVSAKQLGNAGPRQAMLDAIDLALLHQCVPATYAWMPATKMGRAA